MKGIGAMEDIVNKNLNAPRNCDSSERRANGSVRLHSESISNETDESELQYEKYHKPRI